MEKQFAVIGLGRFGSSVALTLHKLGHQVLAIDINEERVQKFSDEVTHAVQADTTDLDALEALGIRNFDVVIVAIGEDMESNVLTTLQLKELGVRNLVAKARNDAHGKMLQKIGADRVIHPERDMGQRVAHNLVTTNILDYIELSPEISLVEITAPQKMIDKTLAEMDFRSLYDINIVAIKRREKIIVPPRATDPIQDQDILIAVGNNKGIQRLEELND